MSGKATTYQTAYAQLVSDVSNKTREVSVTRDAQQALRKPEHRRPRIALLGVEASTTKRPA